MSSKPKGRRDERVFLLTQKKVALEMESKDLQPRKLQVSVPQRCCKWCGGIVRFWWEMSRAKFFVCDNCKNITMVYKLKGEQK